MAHTATLGTCLKCILDLGFREAKSDSDEGLDIDLPTN